MTSAYKVNPTITGLPNELLLTIIIDLPHSSDTVSSDHDRACLALVNHRFFNLLRDSAPFKPLQFPPPFTSQARCHAVASLALPACWQVLCRLERDSLLHWHPAKHLLLCNDCVILHPKSQFTSKQAAKAPYDRTCHPNPPRLLRDGIVKTEDCTCIKWTTLRRLKPAADFHETSRPIEPTCSWQRYHTCGFFCPGFSWPKDKPLLNIMMHMQEHPTSRAILEISQYTWDDEDTAKVWKCYPALKHVRMRPGVATSQTPYVEYGGPDSVNMVARCWFRACAGRHRTLVVQDPLGPEEEDKWYVTAFRQVNRGEAKKIKEMGENAGG